MAKMFVEVYQCEFCKKPIFGVMVGAGRGDGDSFAHRECYNAQPPVLPPLAKGKETK